MRRPSRPRGACGRDVPAGRRGEWTARGPKRAVRDPGTQRECHPERPCDTAVTRLHAREDVTQMRPRCSLVVAQNR